MSALLPAERLRRQAIEALFPKLQKAEQLSGSFMSDGDENNYGRRALRGFQVALGFLKRELPQENESVDAYVERIAHRIREERNYYRDDAEDEDGACSGALEEALEIIFSCKPKS